MKKQGLRDKLRTKIELSKRLYKQGWKEQDLLALFKFLDWVIALPSEFELTYTNAVEKIEEECKMTYVSTAERVGMRKGEALGIQKGKLIGESEMLVSQLNFKFKAIPQKYLDKIKLASADLLIIWAKKLLFASKIEDIFEEEDTVATT